MNKTLITLVYMLAFNSLIHSQTVTEWTQKHPEILLIEADDVSSEMLSRLDESGTDYIIYENEFLIEDIKDHEEKQSISGVVELIDPTIPEAEFIKLWISQHPDTKIIQRSYYDSLDQVKQNIYLNEEIMILQGEFITYSDIEKFHTTQSEMDF